MVKGTLRAELILQHRQWKQTCCPKRQGFETEAKPVLGSFPSPWNRHRSLASWNPTSSGPRVLKHNSLYTQKSLTPGEEYSHAVHFGITTSHYINLSP